MSNVHNNSKKVWHEDVKDNLELTQDEIVLQKLYELGKPQTGRMISEKVHIVPGEISRVIGKLRKDNKILFVKRDKCESSQKVADYWTIPLKINSQNQISIF